MKKILSKILLLLIIAISGYSIEYELTQRDIDEFLSFADDFISMAQNYVDAAEDMTLDELFYSESDQLLISTMEFLESRGWTYEKLNDFLYKTGVLSGYIAMSDQYGDLMEEAMSDILNKDFSEKEFEIVRKNIDKIQKFFRQMDIGGMEADSLDMSELDMEEYDFDLSDLDSEEYDLSDLDMGYKYEDKDKEEIDLMEKSSEIDVHGNDITGNWILNSPRRWSFHFKPDNKVKVEEILGPEARMPQECEGIYKIRGNKVTITFSHKCPVPTEFIIQGNKMVSGELVLTRP